MVKTAEAFKTISEVASELDLPQHVLRFWETRFSQISPMKRGGGRRYYRPEDVELLRGIRHLLYGKGYTIKGVQRILQEQGVRYVMTVWRDMALPGGGAPLTPVQSMGGMTDSAALPPVDVQTGNGEGHGSSSTQGDLDLFSSGDDAHEPLPAGVLPDDAPRVDGASGFRFMDRFRGGEREGFEAGPVRGVGLSAGDVERLQATLYELLECKRKLDQVS
ncbi:MerR family transcriptional regulator [Polycladidibacter hongkongensis]|uniref:MerR family transcriptional regulator n=1 Tax=Polycladidibacter hongkongensis TaxID=1647556 RepID=UPI0008351917|nr:MerR family transcriptional regulator [Pseudovibrio hongkongensis]